MNVWGYKTQTDMLFKQAINIHGGLCFIINNQCNKLSKD